MFKTSLIKALSSVTVGTCSDYNSNVIICKYKAEEGNAAAVQGFMCGEKLCFPLGVQGGSNGN